MVFMAMVQQKIRLEPANELHVFWATNKKRR